MTQFDQRWQEVGGNQYNIGRDMNFGGVQNSVDLIAELEKLKEEVAQARRDGILDKKKATDVEYQITKATQEAEEAKPDKKTILDHLNTAKAFIEDVAAASGVVAALVSAAQVVQKLFQ